MQHLEDFSVKSIAPYRYFVLRDGGATLVQKKMAAVPVIWSSFGHIWTISIHFQVQNEAHGFDPRPWPNDWHCERAKVMKAHMDPVPGFRRDILEWRAELFWLSETRGEN